MSYDVCNDSDSYDIHNYEDGNDDNYYNVHLPV